MTRPCCAYLSMDDMGDFVSDASMSFAPMRALGWDVELVPWRTADVDWGRFTAVYICTPWDYPQDPEAFLQLLSDIDSSDALLVNCRELVLWNLKKTYLRDLESRGADIVPSRWHDNFDATAVLGGFSDHGVDKLVLKPVIGANAVDTFVLKKNNNDGLMQVLERVFADQSFVVQPFVDAIQSEGEYSLFFFAGEYSHAILKTPIAGDFRTQEEHGAAIKSVEPTQELLRAATKVVALIEPQPVYVRADFVRGDNDRFLLMELELIEPSLYFRTNEKSATRFAKAFDAYVRQHVF